MAVIIILWVVVLARLLDKTIQKMYDEDPNEVRWELAMIAWAGLPFFVMMMER